jgi:demethylmenaquinone methyltransferase/2-methoxy-6-polyprenyl-1,4-benzoquinol methylase
MSSIERLLAEQIDYYRHRADEYEDWWFRRGRYDHGPDANAQWFAEAGEVQADLDQFEPVGEVLELACGTGLWTRTLASHASRVTAIDASPEALQVARTKVPDANIDYIQADLFAWEPADAYDLCFFSFWLSHVPMEHWPSFWEKIERALAPGGRVYLIDNARSDRASARDHDLPDPDEETMRRRLADGREYNIIKHWFHPDALQRQLADLGWNAHIRSTAEFFIYGNATPPS